MRRPRAPLDAPDARATQLPQPTTAKWYFPHDDSYSADFNLLLNEMVTRRKLFDVPGVYEARLQIEGCQTNSIQIDVTSPCRPQPGPQDTDCPAVEFTSIAEQGCSEPQRRRVRLIVNILEAPVPKNARLDFGDGSVPMDGYIVMGQSFEIEHFYAVGQIYTARLSIDGCPGSVGLSTSRHHARNRLGPPSCPVRPRFGQASGVFLGADNRPEPAHHWCRSDLGKPLFE